MLRPDLKLELQFLGALADLSLYDPSEARRFVENSLVLGSDFAGPGNHLLYEKISGCIRAGVPASPENILRERDPQQDTILGKVKELVQLEDALGPFLDGYWSKLAELSDRRLSARRLEDALAKIHNGSGNLASIKFALANDLARTRGRQRSKGLDSYIEEVESHLDAVAAGKVRPVTPWYIPRLDQAIGGLQPTLILLGAEPGVGKSALIAAGVHLQAANGHKPLLASLEDHPSWLAYRLVSHDSGRNQFDLRFHRLSQAELESVKSRNKELLPRRANIRIVDGSVTGMKIEDLISSITEGIVNEGCDSIWVDHLGEILLSNSERTDLEIARHLSLLRGLANRFGVPVVVAAHFKRLEDPDRPPTFRDFANSSGAERKARIALGLRRAPGSDLLMVHVMKQTNGPSGQVIDLDFEGGAALVVASEGGIRGRQL